MYICVSVVCLCMCECGCTEDSVCLRACSFTNLARDAPPYCYLHHIINGKKKLLHIKYVFSFSLQLLFETFLILSRIHQDIVINMKTSSRKILVIVFGF